MSEEIKEARLRQAQDWRADNEYFDYHFFAGVTTVTVETPPGGKQPNIELSVWAGISCYGPGPYVISGEWWVQRSTKQAPYKNILVY